MSAAQASKTVAERVSRKMDGDKVEREKTMIVHWISRRVAGKKLNTEMRMISNFVLKNWEKKKDIDSCFRAGKKNSSDTNSL